MKKCGAKTRKGDKCQNQAGQGTDHIGTGRCRLHGGASKGPPKGSRNALKHGIYSRLFSDADMNAAKEMQGSIETELAIARLQLFRLLEEQQNAGQRLALDKVEERTIVESDKEKQKKKEINAFLEHMRKSAKEAGEFYDEDHYANDGEKDESQEESEAFERKRTYQRRDYQGEFIRLTSLIARLEQQLIASRKTKAEIKIIETTGQPQQDDWSKRTDTELDQEFQELINGFKI